MPPDPGPAADLRPWLARRGRAEIGRRAMRQRADRSARLAVLACLALVAAIGLAGAWRAWLYAPPPLTGAARAVDGDSLEVGGVAVRIWGIDAPEWRQLCRLGGRGWEAGVEAQHALATLVRGHSVSCRRRDHDHDRVVASCSVEGRDLAAAMVEAGLAYDYRRYSRGAYRDAEQRAQAAGRGVWQPGASCDLPWDWRAAGR